MYDFCAKHNVPHRHTGKLVVAADAHEEPALLALKKNGENNGVEGLRLIGPTKFAPASHTSPASPPSTSPPPASSPPKI